MAARLFWRCSINLWRRKELANQARTITASKNTKQSVTPASARVQVACIRLVSMASPVANCPANYTNELRILQFPRGLGLCRGQVFTASASAAFVCRALCVIGETFVRSGNCLYFLLFT